MKTRDPGRASSRRAGRRPRGLGARTALLAAALSLALPASAPAAETLGIFSVIGRPGQAPGELQGPIDLTMDSARNVIVADTGNHRVQKFGPDGSLIWSRGKTGADGQPTSGNGPGEFSSPKDAAVAADGTILVADSDNGRVQRLRAADGGHVATYALTFGPQSMTVDGSGFMYMADSSGNRIHKANSAGAVVTSWGGAGSGPGQLSAPFDASVAGGFVYVADGNNARIQKFDTNGGFVKLWGTRATDRDKAKPGEFSQPLGVSATSEGRVFVIDKQTARLDEFDTEGRFRIRFGAERQLSTPGGVFAIGDDVVIADTGNSRVLRLLRAQTPGAGAFCDSSTGTCNLGPGGVPSVAMARGERSDVRFVNPTDVCVRLGLGAHQGKEAFFNGKKYPVVKVAEGWQVTIPAADLAGGSVLMSSRCPAQAGGARARAAQLSFSVVNENVGDVALYDPSGFVRDSKTRRGIRDATVTLQSSPNFSGPFGFADPLSISPRVNPQRTDRRGHYGWDVPNGFYRITVRRFGYRTLRASRVVTVPPPVTDLHVRLRRDPSQQARLIETRGSVGRLRLGMSRTAAQRVARRLRPRPRLRFRGGRLVRIEVRSSRFKTAPGVGVGSNEAGLRLAYGLRVTRRGGNYRIGRVSFVVRRPNRATGRVSIVRVAR